MEPFGVAAAAVTLCPLLIQTARQLRNVAKSFKYARRELEDLTYEMDIFATCYNQFMKVTSERMNKTKSAAAARKQLISWAKGIKLGFRKLSREVDALAQNPIHEHSKTDTFSAHWKWFWNKDNLKYLRDTLIVARQSMVGFTAMCNIEMQDEQLAILKSLLTPMEKFRIEQQYGMSVQERIQILEEEKRDFLAEAASRQEFVEEAVERITPKKFRVQKNDFSSHTDQLLGFSKTVDRQVEHTIFIQQPKERRDESAARPNERGAAFIQRPSERPAEFIRRTDFIRRPNEGGDVFIERPSERGAKFIRQTDAPTRQRRVNPNP